MSHFISLPKGSVPLELRKQVEALLPQPISYPGWKFNRYRWIKLSQINTKDAAGNTDNSVRVGGTEGGTGTRDALEISLDRGIDVTKQTPSVYPEENLADGFGRLKKLLKLGYTEWVFSEYSFDEKTCTEFQSGMEDALDDFRMSANADDGKKPFTVKEVTELCRKRFENRKHHKQSIVKYINTLYHNFSGQQVDAIAKNVIKHYTRQGVIESYDRDEAQTFLKDIGVGADLLNTKDITRTARLFPQIMKNFVDNETTMNIALFDSDACSHEELDKRQKETIDELKEMDDLVLQYAAKRMILRNVNPYDILGSIPQKIVKNQQLPKVLIPVV
jgi:hypothetical protein